jgi:ABC-2 type transport system ATP-binding protein
MLPTAPNADTDAVVAHDLRHRYGAVESVRGVELRIARGEIFALLGPNGAGKTTTLQILEGLRRRSGGEVEVLGSDPQLGGRSWRDRIGVVPQDSHPEPDLTVRECLSLYAGYYARPRPVDDTLADIGLADLAGRRAEQLSGGQRRRLDVAIALIGDPELLFLDEPTTGFDPAARREMWDVVAALRSRGTTILLTTHYMEEAERLADRIAVIADGRIVSLGTPGSLGRRRSMAAEISFTPPAGLDVAALPDRLGAEGPDADGKVRAHHENVLDALSALTSWAIERNVDLPDLEVRRPTLEDVYLELTNPSDP